VTSLLPNTDFDRALLIAGVNSGERASEAAPVENVAPRDIPAGRLLDLRARCAAS
jgi:hypothetical protein